MIVDCWGVGNVFSADFRVQRYEGTGASAASVRIAGRRPTLPCPCGGMAGLLFSFFSNDGQNEAADTPDKSAESDNRPADRRTGHFAKSARQREGRP